MNPNQAKLIENIGLDPSSVTATGSGPLYQIEVGTFRFTGNSVGIATISAGVTGSGGDNVGGDGAILDALTGSGTATITVGGANAAPEPSSLVLFAVTGMLLVFARMAGCFWARLPVAGKDVPLKIKSSRA